MSKFVWRSKVHRRFINSASLQQMKDSKSVSYICKVFLKYLYKLISIKLWKKVRLRGKMWSFSPDNKAMSCCRVLPNILKTTAQLCDIVLYNTLINKKLMLSTYISEVILPVTSSIFAPQTKIIRLLKDHAVVFNGSYTNQFEQVNHLSEGFNDSLNLFRSWIGLNRWMNG